jgi:glycosyltransferase involved in cell wall biosynthesis
MGHRELVERTKPTVKLVSVVIRVRNAAQDLKRCLSSLMTQVIDSAQMEFIVVDNGSTDESLKVAQEYGAIIVKLPAEDFTWGKALNRGIEKAGGEIVLLLSADAYAADTKFVAEMIRPFRDSKITAVYGRQVPRPDAPIDEVSRLVRRFGPESKRFDPDNGVSHPTGEGMLVSNACAAIRKSVWEGNAYDERIEGGEEGVWTYEILRKGYSYVYQASAIVFHSHKDSVLRFVCREVEILQKNCALDGASAGITMLLRWLSRFCVRRLRNCIFTHTDLWVRISGLIRMPLEMIAFCIVFILFKSPVKRQVRPWLWG